MNECGESTVNQSGRGSIWYFVFSKKEGFKVNKVDVWSKVSYIPVDNFIKISKIFGQSFTTVELLRYKHISNIDDDHRTYPIGSTNVELLRQSWNVSKVEPPMFSGLYSDTLLRAEP
jgi:hypothetical protein